MLGYLTAHPVLSYDVEIGWSAMQHKPIIPDVQLCLFRNTFSLGTLKVERASPIVV
jgi:hypothetical protein